MADYLPTGTVKSVPAPDAPLSNKGRVPACPDHKTQMKWIGYSDRYVCMIKDCTLYARRLPEFATTVKQMLGATDAEPVICRVALKLVVDETGKPYLMLVNQNVLIDVSQLVTPSLTAPELVIACEPGTYKAAVEEVKKRTGATQTILESPKMQTVALIVQLFDDKTGIMKNFTNSLVYVEENSKVYAHTGTEWVEVMKMNPTMTYSNDDGPHYMFHPTGSDDIYRSVQPMTKNTSSNYVM